MLVVGSFGFSELQAAVINLTYTRAKPDSHGASSMDPVTGKFYTRSGGWGYGHPDGTANIREYANASAYAADIYSASFTLSNGLYGTYFAVNNGKVLGRGGGGSSLDTNIYRWDAAGAVEAISGSIPDMGGDNGYHSFDWGGYSAVNVMQDQTGIYVVGKQASGNKWQVTKLDPALNVIATKTFTQTQSGNYGYGFMVNGNLFLGTSFNNPVINTQFDFTSGTVSSVSHTLSGYGGPWLYASNTFYDANADTLYIHNNYYGGVYRSANISSTLGVGSAVPEPTTLAIWSTLSGLGLIATRRRGKLALVVPRM